MCVCVCVYVCSGTCVLLYSLKPILTVMCHRQISLGIALLATNTYIKVVAAVSMEALVYYSVQLHRCFHEDTETIFTQLLHVSWVQLIAIQYQKS